MSSAINIQCRPTPLLWASGGVPVLVQVDEAGRVQADETILPDGSHQTLMPDPEAVITHGDENKTPLTDENGALNLPEPGPGP